jgi:death-on-curing protein
VSEPIFLTLGEVMRIHARSLAEHGGADGVRDSGLIESALGSAKNTFFYGTGDLFDVAASYAFHLSEAQAFLDGNKRTAVGAALIFLARNGDYVMPPFRQLHQAMLDIAAKRMSKESLAKMLRDLARGTD